MLLVLLGVAVAGDLPSFAGSETAPASIELAQGWKLASARAVPFDGAAVSSSRFDDRGWHAVQQMPATVLQALQDDGVYRDLYNGTNLRDAVPRDLYEQDWWYRTTFTAPAGHSTYTLQFPGINYRAEVWLNGRLIAGSDQIVGMYTSHDLDVSAAVNPGGPNTLAVKITPERALQDVDGVELADSWWDWLNGRYIGYQAGYQNAPHTATVATPAGAANNISFVPDRNAGIWKPVYLKASGAVSLGPAAVTTELPLPKTDSARLTVYADARNSSARTVHGALRATITRPGKPDIEVEQSVTLQPGEDREIALSPESFAALTVHNPDLWWPYTLGAPNLYDLHLEFRQYDRVLDATTQRFGIRTVTGHRDGNAPLPGQGTGGNFYLQVNGRDMLVRGATYAPDLLFRNDPARETAVLRYVKDLGLNMVRLEGKFPGEHLLDEADELGIPMMYGWMCCNQWEKWGQWNPEDRQVAQDSMRSQIEELRPHASAFLWANGSDGRPPPEVRGWYRDILSELHWQNATVDTVSSINRDDDGDIAWDGIQMAGPYSWRPPSYWFAGTYPATMGSSAEQGDNEHIPPFASLKEFIPADKLWPINDTWYFHAGADANNSQLSSIRAAVVRRYGSSASAEEFARKAQLAHYESTRAQFESYAANGWADHKMTIYWMLNNHWPSFFGNLFDYYLRPGGAYYGAKDGLRPLSVVFDSYATDDHTAAKITIVNQTGDDRDDLRARIRVYDLNGNLRDDRTSAPVDVSSNGAALAMTLPREATDSPVFFVRAELLGADGAVLADNVYWQSQQRDDVGGPANDTAFTLTQDSWADMTALNTMPRVPLRVEAQRIPGDPAGAVNVRLSNDAHQIAFFERVEALSTRDGDEVLPIEYSDNYVTVFPGESVTVHAAPVNPDVRGSAINWVRVAGYNGAPVVAPVDGASR
ncbi:MAG TPA: beta galactosidase jelly roll domain-containing protein [Mycobacterium sp.]|nr:beta galactosidase jelly roll domain-containing protein [Mycobacterium sp.]